MARDQETLEERSAEATLGRAQREQHASHDNLQKRQAIFAYREPERCSGRPAIESVPWEGTERVLEVGCGNGVWLRALRSGHALGSVVGLDLSAGMLEAARAEDPGQPVVGGDVGRLPFPEASFDVVMALWMLYHVADHRGALEELHRVLRPGGRLLVATNSARQRPLDAVLVAALDEVTGSAREQWLPQLNFTAENGPGIVGQVFGEVAVEEVRSTFAIPTPEPALGVMASMRGPIEAFCGETLDWPAVEAAARRRLERAIALDGVFRTEIVAAWFVAQRAPGALS